MLQAANLSIGYPHHRVARGIDLSVGRGEVLCLLGPNGAGKTTLFKTLLGLIPAQGGEVTLDSRPIASLARAELARSMAYVPQAQVMLSHLVGAANRADIRRLAELEAENDRLRAKLVRQQDQLRDGLVSRDARIHELNGLLARRIAEVAAAGQQDDASDRTTLEGLVASLEQRLRSESNRRVAVEERLARLTDELARERDQHGA